MIRDAERPNALLSDIHHFITAECMPLEEQADHRSGVLPDGLVQRMRQLGLFGHSMKPTVARASLAKSSAA